MIGDIRSVVFRGTSYRFDFDPATRESLLHFPMSPSPVGFVSDSCEKISLFFKVEMDETMPKKRLF